MVSLDARATGVAAAARLGGGSSIDAGEEVKAVEEHLNVEFLCHQAEEAVRSISGPPPEVYTRLMAVFDSAGKPLKAVDLALRLISGRLPLSHPLGGSGALEDVQSIVVEAMCITNEAGLLKASELLFKESLTKSEGFVCPLAANQVRSEILREGPDSKLVVSRTPAHRVVHLHIV